jgi:hypothetical protein
MRWQDIQVAYPNAWLVVEAIQSHQEDNLFVPDDLAVVETCCDGADAFAAYRRRHRANPEREWLFVHTSRQHLRVEQRPWLGMRMATDESHSS